MANCLVLRHTVSKGTITSHIMSKIKAKKRLGYEVPLSVALECKPGACLCQSLQGVDILQGVNIESIIDDEVMDISGSGYFITD